MLVALLAGGPLERRLIGLARKISESGEMKVAVTFG
jgi:hypothetical protein